MAEFVLNAEVRTNTGKGDSRRLRVAGSIPAVIYGKGFEPIHCVFSRSELEKTIARMPRNAIITVNFAKSAAEQSREVILRDYQKHPISHFYTHIDFQTVDHTLPVQVDVEIKFVGTPIGRKTGAIFTIQNRSLRIECLPKKIPASIELDITNLDAGQSLHVSDLPASEFKIVTNPKITLCQMSIVREEVVAPVAAAPGAEGAAPPTAATAGTAAPATAPAAGTAAPTPAKKP